MGLGMGTISLRGRPLWFNFNGSTLARHFPNETQKNEGN
jgi:hypothetical protein